VIRWLTRTGSNPVCREILLQLVPQFIFNNQPGLVIFLGKKWLAKQALKAVEVEVIIESVHSFNGNRSL